MCDVLKQHDQVFSGAEKQQVREMLAFSDAQVDAVVRAVQNVYRDAATFGQVDRNLLCAAGVADDVARAVDKVWRKKGRPGSAESEPGAAELPPQILRSTGWQLNLEMGQSQVRGQTIPTAVFQMQLADPGAKATVRSVESLSGCCIIQLVWVLTRALLMPARVPVCLLMRRRTRWRWR